VIFDFYFGSLVIKALIPFVYPIALLLSDQASNENFKILENLKYSSGINKMQISSKLHEIKNQADSIQTNLNVDYKSFLAISEYYLSTIGIHLAQNSNDYVRLSEDFMKTEQDCVFNQRSSCEKHLLQLVQTEFHHIIMWSNDFDRQSTNTIETGSKYKSKIDKSANLNDRIRAINEIISILSSKTKHTS
jgi:hypothetical protein